MRLTGVVLEGFRRYRQPIRIRISDMTAFIGRNDAGKSTILDALDIFFDGGTAKLECADACKAGDAARVRIACTFADFPLEITLDRGAITSLAAEHLLNADGELEIHKVWDLSGAKPKGPIVSARALHPSSEPASGLLAAKQKDLQKLVKELSLQCSCNMVENPSMRAAVYAACGDLKLAETDVPLNGGGEDSKSVWAALERYLPVYALFKSDRESSDQDREVQDPMKVAIKKAMAAMEATLQTIAESVEAQACETAKRTVEHLRASYPVLASTLMPKFRKPNWDSVFKLDLASDDEIPLNKRGSGVRRLVLLSFFEAEAARRQHDRQEAGKITVPAIYAIEEPETSQHPDNQVMIIEALKALAASGEQVIVTTHVPALAGLLPVDSLRYIDTDPATERPRIRSGSDDVYAEVAEALGVYPTVIQRSNGDSRFPRVAVCVEGYTDESALRSLGRILFEADQVNVSVDSREIFWVSAGGSGLHAWVQRRYLDNLGIPQVYIMDSDQLAADGEMKPETAKLVASLANRPNCAAFVTRKREIENYVHPEAVRRVTGGAVDLGAGCDLDYCDMEEEFTERVLRAVQRGDCELRPVAHDGSPLPLRKNKAKEIINAFVMPHMTEPEVRERCRYAAHDGQERHEVHDWFEAIGRFALGQAAPTEPRLAEGDEGTAAA
jgi:putative ATP-dependent endonuclease of the OLD family